jgi:hypothetical protein
MTAAEIAASLGNARREGGNWRCRCPLHDGTSLALRDGHRGLLVKCWGGCSSIEILAELRRLGLLSGRSDGMPPAPMPARYDNSVKGEWRIVLARRIWDGAREARGTPVVRYLAGRGITMPSPPSLRWAPTLRRPDGAYAPALVARVDNVDGELIGVHRTWLMRDEDGIWRRRDRAMLGCVAGGAVRLAPAAETLLMIGEGIETCLAAMQATGQPTWAALSTSGMTALRLPAMVRHVIILADHDRNGAGERAGLAAAQRWHAEGRRVRIAMPRESGWDFADVLLAGRPHIAGGRDAA